MAKFFATPADFDAAVADELVLEVFRKRDLTHTSSRWGESVSTPKIGELLAEIFTAQHVVENRADLKAHPEKAAWAEDVAEEFFGGNEPLMHSASTPEEEAARDRVVGLLWEYCGTSLTSPLNKTLSESDGYVLVQARVPKSRPRAGTKGVPHTADGRFLTTDFELIRDLTVDHSVLAWKRSTEKFEAVLKEIAFRQPQLQLAMAKYVGKDVPAITGLLVHADAKRIEAMLTEAKALEAATPVTSDGDDEDPPGDEH